MKKSALEHQSWQESELGCQIMCINQVVGGLSNELRDAQNAINDLKSELKNNDFDRFSFKVLRHAYCLLQAQWSIFAEYGIAIKNSIKCDDLPQEIIDFYGLGDMLQVACELEDTERSGTTIILVYNCMLDDVKSGGCSSVSQEIKLTLDQYKKMEK